MTEESSDLKSKIIANIALRVGDGKSSRWDPCKQFLHLKNVGTEVSAKKYSMYRLVHPADENLINNLSLDDLVEYHEMVIKRFYTQM